MNSTPKHSWLSIDATAVGFCLALTAVVYILGVHPVISSKADIVRRERELNDSRQQAEALAATLTTMRRELAAVEQALADSPLRLQPVSAVNQRLALITELASDQQLKLNEIQPGKSTHGSHYDTVPIVITGSGNYRTIAAFLHRLHRTFPDTGVAAFSLTGSPATPDAPAGFRFNLSWYAAPIDRINTK